MCHFILLLTIVCTVVVATLGDNTSESYWLLRIKSELVDPLGALRNWSPTTTQICSWNGLTCALDQARVVGLNLSGSGLSGSISGEFSHLISLQSLDLSSNSLTGSIPSELGKLQNLRTLLLYSNYLSGAIPKEIGNLSKLQVLRLGDNMLEGEITPSIGNLSELTVFGVANCNLNGSIPVEVGKLKNLVSLDLQVNSLSVKMRHFHKTSSGNSPKRKS